MLWDDAKQRQGSLLVLLAINPGSGLGSRMKSSAETPVAGVGTGVDVKESGELAVDGGVDGGQRSGRRRDG